MSKQADRPLKKGAIEQILRLFTRAALLSPFVTEPRSSLARSILPFILLGMPVAAQFTPMVSCAGGRPLNFRPALIRSPLIADLIGESTATTPWGVYTQIINGKFWRTRDGKFRQDDPYGNTYLFLWPNEVWIDHELRTATILITNHPSPFGSEGISGVETCRPVDPEKGILNGRETVGIYEVARHPLHPTWEWASGTWWDSQWGVMMQRMIKFQSWEFTQQLRNVEERDPDVKLFEIPAGYTVITCIPSKKAKLPASCPSGLLSSPPGPNPTPPGFPTTGVLR